MERLVRRCAAQIGCFFGLSGLPMALFYLKIGLDIGRDFAKCLIFYEFFLSLPIGCQKVLMHANLQRALQETNGLDIGCKFASSLV